MDQREKQEIPEAKNGNVKKKKKHLHTQNYSKQKPQKIWAHKQQKRKNTR